MNEERNGLMSELEGLGSSLKEVTGKLDQLDQQLQETRGQLANRISAVEGFLSSHSATLLGPAPSAGAAIEQVNQAIQKLSVGETQEQILEIFLSETRHFVERSVLFLKQENGFEPHKSIGFPEETLHNVRLEHPGDPILRAADDRKIIYRSDQIADGFPWVSQAGALPASAVCVPFVFGDQVPLVFYGDAPRGIQLDSIELLTHLTVLILKNNYLESISGQTASEPVLKETSAEAVIDADELEDDSSSRPEAAAEADDGFSDTAAWSLPATEEPDSAASEWSFEPPAAEPPEFEPPAELETAFSEPPAESDVTQPLEFFDGYPESREPAETDPLTARANAAEEDRPDWTIDDGEQTTVADFPTVPGDEESEPWQADEAATLISPVEEAPEIVPDEEDSVTAESPPPPATPEPAQPPVPPGHGLPEEEYEKYSTEARRFARLLVSEIKLYNEEQVENGRQKNDLYERLQADIDRSREMYQKRIHPSVRQTEDHFHAELVRILANGDEASLGGHYPGAILASDD